MSSVATSPTLIASPIDRPADSFVGLAPPPNRNTNALIHFDDDDDEDDLSADDIARLLREAEERMSGNSSAVAKASGLTVNSLRLPKLDPGAALPKPPIAQGTVARITSKNILVPTGEQKLADSAIEAPPAVAQKVKKAKDDKPATAGPKWYDMPRTDLTDSKLKRDMQIIKARNVLDPHRHYRKDTSALPEYSQVGTIIEGNTEFFTARINRKERKKTIVDEILADGTSRDRFKRKYDELQKGKKSGKKEFYKKLKEQRKPKISRM